MNTEKELVFKYTTWSIMNLDHLTNNEKVALAFINAATPNDGISTGALQRYLKVATPTMHKVLKGLIEHGEIQRASHGIWITTSVEKLF